MTSIIQKILASDKMEPLYRSFITKNNKYWGNRISVEELVMWLDNFDSDEELYYALKLADNILFYTYQEIKDLCNAVFLKRCKAYFFENIFPLTAESDFHAWFEDTITNHSIFIGLGDAEKSGKLILPVFNKVCSNYELTLMEEYEFLHTNTDLSSIRFVFLIDDFIGSGNQAIDYWKHDRDGKSYQKRSLEYPDIKFVYLALVGMKDGKEIIERKTPLKVLIGDMLDNRFRCFSDSSIIFTDPIERPIARRIMETKGAMLCKSYPLGYDNSELAIAFHHNTPDNTLPVIWKRMKDNSWHPLFERLEKVV